MTLSNVSIGSWGAFDLTNVYVVHSISINEFKDLLGACAQQITHVTIKTTCFVEHVWCSCSHVYFAWLNNKSKHMSNRILNLEYRMGLEHVKDNVVHETSEIRQPNWSIWKELLAFRRRKRNVHIVSWILAPFTRPKTLFTWSSCWKRCDLFIWQFPKNVRKKIAFSTQYLVFWVGFCSQRLAY